MNSLFFATIVRHEVERQLQPYQARLQIIEWPSEP